MNIWVKSLIVVCESSIVISGLCGCHIQIIEGADGSIHWESIAGLEQAKRTVQEVIVWPMMNPKLFTGARAPPKVR